MSNDNERENFDHAKAGVGDRITTVGEMEHLRRHALRSAISSEEGSELAFNCLVWAKQLQDMRREYMRKHFGEIDDKLWCMCKSAACLRQLAYEVDGVRTTSFPTGDRLNRAKPVIEYVPGFGDVSGVRTYADLPEAAKNYIRYLENAVGCHISYVSVGAGRDEYIKMD